LTATSTCATSPPELEQRRRAVKRQPYFCAGCPHNISTWVPEGWAAIGPLHGQLMERSTEGLIQMGGEGVDGYRTRCSRRCRMSSRTTAPPLYLAIRQAAAKANITHKILTTTWWR
jgi:indolepyruvate ferredoxin oxidoreductase